MQTITKSSLIDRNDHKRPSAIIVKPWEIFQIETVAPYDKPNLTGPVQIEWVQKWDTIAITIHDIKLWNDGVMFFGHNKDEYRSGVLRKETDSSIEKRIPIVNNLLQFDKDLKIPISPMVWWISLINESIQDDTGDHGWNIDTKELAVWSTLFLHDKDWCGKILVGDVHAAMGDGEVCGTGIEISAQVQVSVEIISRTKAHRPILVTDTHIICLATRDAHEEAYSQCIRDMVGFVQENYWFSFAEANCFVSVVCDLRVSTVVANRPTYKILIEKKYLENWQVRFK